MTTDDVTIFKRCEAKLRNKYSLGHLIIFMIRDYSIKILAYIFEIEMDRIQQISFAKCAVDSKRSVCHVAPERIREFLTLYRHRLPGFEQSPLFGQLMFAAGNLEVGVKFDIRWMSEYHLLALLKQGKEDLVRQIIKEPFEIQTGRTLLPILLSKDWEFDLHLSCDDLSYSLCHQIIRIYQGYELKKKSFFFNEVNFVPIVTLAIVFQSSLHQTLVTYPFVWSVFANAIRDGNMEYVEYAEKLGICYDGITYKYSSGKDPSPQMLTVLTRMGVKVIPGSKDK